LGQEVVQGPRIPFDLDQDAAHTVLDEAGQLQTRSQPVNERAKADPLDDSVDGDRTAFHDTPREC
jgi:hypothetical protein